MRAPRVRCKLCGNRGSVKNKTRIVARHHPWYLCDGCMRGVIASSDPGTLRAAYLEKATWESARDCIQMINKEFPL
jgi:hypothetical protein